MKFVMWSCGHAHQEDETGLVSIKRDECNPTWYVLEVPVYREQYYHYVQGLQPGDYTLHKRIVDDSFGPATTLDGAEDAYHFASFNTRRLMIFDRHPQYMRWIEATLPDPMIAFVQAFTQGAT